MHSLIPLSLFLITLLGFAFAALRARRSSIVLNEQGLDALLRAVAPVDFGGLACVAQEYLEPQKNQQSMEPEVIWHLLGGELGLRRMRDNSRLLLALAAHVSDWNDEEGRIVSERMRRDAIRLRTAVRQIRLGMVSQMVTGHHWISVPFHLQEAASAYYLMRQRLLALMEASNIALLPALSQAL